MAYVEVIILFVNFYKIISAPQRKKTKKTQKKERGKLGVYGRE